jgi:alpha-glucosidase
VAPWWKSAIIYQIYPRSFLDTDGDGVGDLHGVISKLDYLSWLGVDGIWLSPIYPSPMADFGYDVADYCDVDPVFGDLATLDRLVEEAHTRGLKLLLDWVPNHTSSKHPWFTESSSSRTNPRRDFYIWRDGRQGGRPPNNWMSAWNKGSVWSFDAVSQQWYLHSFLAEQPDLNWANPSVRAAMRQTLKFWLDRGVDGFRMDVINLIGKDPDLLDDPADLSTGSHFFLNDRPETHEYLREIRSELDRYDGDRASVGEITLREPDRVFPYVGVDALHLAFNFELIATRWQADLWASAIDRNNHSNAEGWWPTLVLNNHDVPRLRTRAGGSEARARVAAAILLCARGTPFLYAGEELGLLDGIVPDERVVDPGGRDGCRCPIPWEPSGFHGWTTGTPWLPFPPEASARAVAAQRDDPSSMLSWYRKLLDLRRRSRVLTGGSLRMLDAPEGVVAFERRDDADVIELWANFTAEPVTVDLTGTVLASSVDAVPVSTLPADAVVLVDPLNAVQEG